MHRCPLRRLVSAPVRSVPCRRRWAPRCHVFVAICNPVGDNGAGRTFTGVTFICDPFGVVIAEVESGTDGMIVADLCTSAVAESRREATVFFRHFRRPEMYRRWENEVG